MLYFSILLFRSLWRHFCLPQKLFLFKMQDVNFIQLLRVGSNIIKQFSGNPGKQKNIPEITLHNLSTSDYQYLDGF